jgi:hypothetical protein
MAKKKYSFTVDEDRFFYMEKEESLSSCEFLKDFFHQARAHATISMAPYTANFYCRGTIIVDEVKTINYKIKYNKIYEALTEVDHIVKENEGAQKSYRLEVNGDYVGHYLIEKNILVACDWTHNEFIAEIAEKILRYLEKDGIISKLKQTKEKPEIKVVLGGDPEFECLNKNMSVVGAGNYFGSYEGKIGRDGSGDQLELRPDPQETVKGLLTEFKMLISQASEVCCIGSQGDYYPLGGHIHFSFRDESGRILKFDNRKCADILDDFIGFTTDWSGRARGSYKSRHAYRNQPHGFEYRSVPSKVWESPQILRIVTKLSQNLLHKAINDGIEYEIEKNGEPSKKDYLNFISEREYEKLKNWPKISPGYIVTKNWGIKIIPPKLRLTIAFNDDWRDAHKNYIREQLNNLVATKPRTILFFGIGKKRGNVISGFTSKACETTEMPHDKEEGFFGFPLEARVSSSPLLIDLVRDLIINLKAKGFVE